MKMNDRKTKVMVFNRTRHFQFPPELIIKGCDLELVTEHKVLGLVITSDLKWHSHVEQITKKARQRIWTLRRLRKLGFENDILLDVYVKEIRPILEFSCPVWSGSLTIRNREEIETVQKTVIKFMLGYQYTSYTEACEMLNVEKLTDRREKLCKKFAFKDLKKPNSIFEKKPATSLRSSKYKKVKEPQTRTKRYQMSAIPYLSKIINNSHLKK